MGHHNPITTGQVLDDMPAEPALEPVAAVPAKPVQAVASQEAAGDPAEHGDFSMKNLGILGDSTRFK